METQEVTCLFCGFKGNGYEQRNHNCAVVFSRSVDRLKALLRSYGIDPDEEQPVVPLPDKEDHIHVDDFIDSSRSDSSLNYPRFFLFLHRLNATFQQVFAAEMAKYKLFCLYKGKQYRVTGASRLGDIWLTADFARDVGYELRVYADECSDWSPTPANEPDSGAAKTPIRVDLSGSLSNVYACLKKLHNSGAIDVVLDVYDLQKVVIHAMDSSTALTALIDDLQFLQNIANLPKAARPAHFPDMVLGKSLGVVAQEWITALLEHHKV